MAFFVPDEYCNQIRRKPKPATRYGYKGAYSEANFPTWQEAHAWIVERNKKEVESLKSNLRNAENRLKRSLKMTEF